MYHTFSLLLFGVSLHWLRFNGFQCRYQLYSVNFMSIVMIIIFPLQLKISLVFFFYTVMASAWMFELFACTTFHYSIVLFTLMDLKMMSLLCYIARVSISFVDCNDYYEAYYYKYRFLFREWEEKRMRTCLLLLYYRGRCHFAWIDSFNVLYSGYNNDYYCCFWVERIMLLNFIRKPYIW